ncbi:MAG: hypothetical protein TH68_08155 [Candidatus Synechococcus spongiarum 142]|uniref:Uncharacterized protein n=1 Tax=Candidatus Synechococcus spongiarum 142 TaxID=1608213 RepID=A0A6N3X7C2_9SYNE|nr:MAG: hypothetical protein TH68_08155 [Candidatus Synechococcus spongiarum 142]
MVQPISPKPIGAPPDAYGHQQGGGRHGLIRPTTGLMNFILLIMSNPNASRHRCYLLDVGSFRWMGLNHDKRTQGNPAAEPSKDHYCWVVTVFECGAMGAQVTNTR